MCSQTGNHSAKYLGELESGLGSPFGAGAQPLCPDPSTDPRTPEPGWRWGPSRRLSRTYPFPTWLPGAPHLPSSQNSAGVLILPNTDLINARPVGREWKGEKTSGRPWNRRIMEKHKDRSCSPERWCQGPFMGSGWETPCPTSSNHLLPLTGFGRSVGCEMMSLN